MPDGAIQRNPGTVPEFLAIGDNGSTLMVDRLSTYKFTFTIECAGDGTADLARVEEMIDLSMQDLVFDDEFIAALDEKESVAIQVLRIG